MFSTQCPAVCVRRPALRSGPWPACPGRKPKIKLLPKHDLCTFDAAHAKQPGDGSGKYVQYEALFVNLSIKK